MRQSDLAQAADIDPAAVWRLEAGAHYGLSVKYLEGLAHAFSVSLDAMNAYLRGDMSVDDMNADSRTPDNLDGSTTGDAPKARAS